MANEKNGQSNDDSQITDISNMSFEEAYRILYPQMRNALYKFGLEPDEMEDILQDTFFSFAKIFDRLKREFRQESTINTYVYRILLNTKNAYFIKKNNPGLIVEVESLDDAERSRGLQAIVDDLPGPEEQLLAKEQHNFRRGLAEQALNRLKATSPNSYAYITMKYFSDKQTEEIATAFGKSSNLIDAMLTKAKRKLNKFYKRLLKEQEVEVEKKKSILKRLIKNPNWLIFLLSGLFLRAIALTLLT